MNDRIDQPLPNNETVTWVITHRVDPARRREFEEWASGIGSEVKRFPGSYGVMVLKPSAAAGDEYVMVARFASIGDLEAWEASPQRKLWLDRVTPFITAEPEYRAGSGLETWFQLPGQKVVVPPPKHRMAVVVLLAIYPLLMIVVPLLGALIGDNRFLAIPVDLDLELATRTLISASTLVALMTWVVMPPLTRVLQKWLYSAL